MCAAMARINDVIYHFCLLQLTAVLDTAVLSREQRLYLPLYLELLFESPILRDSGALCMCSHVQRPEAIVAVVRQRARALFA